MTFQHGGGFTVGVVTSDIDKTIAWFIEGSAFLHTPEDQRLARVIYELLATGRPAGVDELAQRTDGDLADVEQRLATWPAIFRNAEGAVVGFLGLASDELSHHRLEANGAGAAWAWCAFDTLIITRVLGTTVRVTSQCPVTQRTVRLTVTPEGVVDVDPATAVMSMLPPDQASFDDAITTLCHYIHFFASRDAAESWARERRNTFVVSVEDAFEIGRQMTDAVFASVIEPSRPTR